VICIRKIYDEFLRDDARIRNHKPNYHRTIHDDDKYEVDINLYLTDHEENFYVSTVRVVYKEDNLDTETKYDYGIPPTRDPERILDIIKNGIDEIWGGVSHFIWFNKAFIKEED